MNVSVAYNQFNGRLQVESSAMRIEQRLAMASFGMSLDGGWLVRAWVGGVLDGQLYDSSHSGLTGGGYGEHTIEGGWLASAQIAKRLLDQDGVIPFIQGTFTAGWSQLRMTPKTGHPAFGRKDGFLATDLRLSVSAGWTVAGVWTPYVSARFFAAPFYWHQGDGWYTSDPYRSGQDVDHFQVGVGSTFTLPGNFALFVDYAALGETALTAGLGYSWTTGSGKTTVTTPATR